MEPAIELRTGPFPEVLSDLHDGSVTAVVADPPWNDLVAWRNVATFAARVLEPGGTLVGYIGNRWCFEALDLLSERLQRVRLAFLPAPHEEPWDPETKCLEAGSFIVIMANGTFRPRRQWSNAVRGTVRGRRWHAFQRPLVNVRHYVEAFSDRGDLVVDPFLGSGTTAVACAQLGRRFVGSDILGENVDRTRARLDELREPFGDVGALPSETSD